jgi:hypothetical protein
MPQARRSSFSLGNSNSCQSDFESTVLQNSPVDGCAGELWVCMLVGKLAVLQEWIERGKIITSGRLSTGALEFCFCHIVCRGLKEKTLLRQPHKWLFACARGIGHLTKKKIGHLSSPKIPQMPDAF